MQSVFIIITGIIGGVALFLFGMNVLSNYLTSLAGGQLESMLEKFTDKPIKGWLLAVIITAIMQSSSATTVLTVGLVNSGILELSKAVSILIGANLGTTATAWLLSLNSFKSETFLLNLFSPSVFSPYLAITGVTLQMLAKSEKKKNIGGIMLGFSIMMIGMKLMGDAVTPLKQNPDFENMLTKYSSPLVIFAMAVLFTLIIQSSDATIGMLQALAIAVPVDLLLAIPIICGAQVGTCISAILSSINAGKNGKRTALIQLYYHLIKNVPFIILFHIASFSPFRPLLDNTTLSAVGIAIFHSLINIVFSIIMLPASGLLVYLAVKTIPYTDSELKAQEEKLSILDPIFLDNPSFAITKVKEALNIIADAIDLTFNKYINKNYDVMSDKINRIDEYEATTKKYINNISQKRLSTKESVRLGLLQEICLDCEIINNQMKTLHSLVLEMQEKGISFSEETAKELAIFSEATMDTLSIVMVGIMADSPAVSETIQSFREMIDDIHSRISSRYIKRLHQKIHPYDTSMYFTDICYAYEHIIDRCDKISVSLSQLPRNKKKNKTAEPKENPS